MFENLNFGKTGFQTSVFEKYFLSYSCISSIKFNALRSFCNFLLYFSRKFFFFFFLNFDRSKVFFDWSKLQLKVLAWLCVFRSIEPIFRSIESHIESFLKTKFLMCSSLFKLFSKLSLSIWSIQGSKQDFCRFQPNFFKDFCHLRPIRPLYPSFFFYFQFSCIFVMHLGLFSNLREIGIFDDSSIFFGKWSMVFCYGTI